MPISQEKQKKWTREWKVKERRPTEDLSMVPNLKRPLRKMGKSDQKVGAQADRPGINTGVNYNRNYSFHNINLGYTFWKRKMEWRKRTKIRYKRK